MCESLTKVLLIENSNLVHLGPNTQTISKCDAEIRLAKKNHLDALATKLSTGSSRKDWWQASRTVFGDSKSVDNITLVKDGSLVNNKITKADLFNQYFAGITNYCTPE